MNCNRCEIRKPTIKCLDCQDYVYLCSNCSDFLHSLLTSQQTHKLEELKSNSSIDVTNNNKQQFSFKNSLNNSNFVRNNDVNYNVNDQNTVLNTDFSLKNIINSNSQENSVNMYNDKYRENINNNNNNKEDNANNDYKNSTLTNFNKNNTKENIFRQCYSPSNIRTNDVTERTERYNGNLNKNTSKNQSYLLEEKSAFSDSIRNQLSTGSRSEMEKKYKEYIDNLEQINELHLKFQTENNYTKQTSENYMIEAKENNENYTGKNNILTSNNQYNEHNTNKEVSKTLPSNFYNQSLLHNAEKERKELENFKQTNYVLNLKKIYETEINDLTSRNNSLNQALLNMKNSFEGKIEEYERMLLDKNTYQSEEISNLEIAFDKKLAEILSEKDKSIDYLNHVIEEHKEDYSNLQLEIKQMAYEFKNYKLVASEKEKNFTHHLKKKEMEIDELKKYIEVKIKYLENKNSEDNLSQLSANERIIDNLINDYNENKRKYVSIIEQKDKEISNLINSGKKSDEQYSKIIADLRKSEIEYKNKLNSVVVKYDQQKYDCEYANTQVNQLEKENAVLKYDIKKIEKHNRDLEDSKIELSTRLEKVQGIKYGKFNINTEPNNVIKEGKKKKK